MTFSNTIREILCAKDKPMTPQEIREEIKDNYPHFYGTESHLKNVRNGHYKDIDHAVLAQIYSAVKTGKKFFCNKQHKPVLVSLIDVDNVVQNSTNEIRRTSVNSISNIDGLILNLDYYYKRSLEVLKSFGGPSIYFHTEAIQAQKTSFLSDRHIEMIYATLASWGMHRMGNPEDTKAKMVEFSKFKKSILDNKDKLGQLFPATMNYCSPKQYEEHLELLKDVYFSLKVSISDSTIVAHSKTLAHILPNLIPPIDRQYTIRFFTQGNREFFTNSGNYKPVYVPYGIKNQFAKFKEYCCLMKTILDRSETELFELESSSFNTSYPKIIDNLIMAFVKEVPKPTPNNTLP
jgi:hypothetical protein